MSGDSTRSTDGITVAAAVDFGTHGSGYAWSVKTQLNDSADTREIHFANYRTAPGSVSRDKNLSAVLTNSAGEVAEWGYSARERWNGLTESRRAAGWGYATGYKMALRADSGHLGVARGLGSADVSRTDSVLALVTGCLARVRASAVREITDAGYSPDDIRWCLTVPAIWDEDDKQLMREAAVAAGFPDDDERLLLAIEPEAAAISCDAEMAKLIDGSGHGERLPLKRAGTRFMVVDCGGGTVDITAYESLENDRVRLSEIGKVCGGRLGSDYLNHAFRTELLADRLGADIASRLSDEYPRDLQRMDNEWELYKTSDLMTISDMTGDGVRLDESAQLRVDVPGQVWDLLGEDRRRRLTDAAGGRPYRLVFGAAEVQRVFDKLIDPILDRIDEQLTAMREEPPRTAGPTGGMPYEAMLLVGGMSRSGYLRERIQRRFGDRIRVLWPAQHAFAVLAGAVHFSYDPEQVASRRARHTYGVAMYMPWEEADGPERRELIDGKPMCKRFKIAVVRGQSVDVGQAVEQHFHPVNRETKAVGLKFYRTWARQPRYVTETGCEPIGTVEVPVSSHLRAREEDRFTLRMYFGRTQIEAAAVDNLTGAVTKGTVDFRRMH